MKDDLFKAEDFDYRSVEWKGEFKPLTGEMIKDHANSLHEKRCSYKLRWDEMSRLNQLEREETQKYKLANELNAKEKWYLIEERKKLESQQTELLQILKLMYDTYVTGTYCGDLKISQITNIILSAKSLSPEFEEIFQKKWKEMLA